MDSKTFVDTVAMRLNRPKEEVARMIEALGGIVGETLKNGDVITVPSVGTFEPRKRLERVSVHPTTGRRLLIPPKLLVGFKPSSLLKQRIK